MQPVDYTTLTAVCAQLRRDWVPARVEQVYQRDRYTIALCLRNLKQRGWLTICWHPQAARICLGDPPPRVRDTFTFSDQLRHQLGKFALISIDAIAPWERVIDLQFAHRPGEAAVWHLYVEIMGKYSNVTLTDANNLIITTAHQVGAQQSSVRTIQTGQRYEYPPALTASSPNLQEAQQSWQERVSLIPGAIARQLLKSYRGLSPTLTRLMSQGADIDPQSSTNDLTEANWQKLWQCWREWLQAIEKRQFQPGWTHDGYTVLPWGNIQPVENVQELLNEYYTNQINRQTFQQLRHQLSQKISNLLGKLRQKASNFQQRLQQSDAADLYRQQADLLMAHLHDWQPGMASIVLNDFDTGEPVKIALNPEKNAIYNAQALYKRHQKLKRARQAVVPLLQEVEAEISYLEQVEVALNQIEKYRYQEDLQALTEIRQELTEQGYLSAQQHNQSNTEASQPYRYLTPSGFPLLIGRNNRQNDQLTFRTAVEYDLWFHTQEIAGSHGLLRLEPGAVASEADLQFAADLIAYYSRGRESDQVPVIYTEPKHVYKPKGAKPGMAIYKHERVIWGRPQKGKLYVEEEK